MLGTGKGLSSSILLKRLLIGFPLLKIYIFEVVSDLVGFIIIIIPLLERIIILILMVNPLRFFPLVGTRTLIVILLNLIRNLKNTKVVIPINFTTNRLKSSFNYPMGSQALPTGSFNYVNLSLKMILLIY